MVASLTISMILIGLWHGLSYTFLVFGALQGFYISASVLTMPYRERLVARFMALSPVHLVVGLHLSSVTVSLPARLPERRDLGQMAVFAPLSAAFGMLCVYAIVSFSMIFWQAHTFDAAILHLRLLARTIPPAILASPTSERISWIPCSPVWSSRSGTAPGRRASPGSHDMSAAWCRGGSSVEWPCC